MLAELHSHTYYSHGTKVFYDGVNSPDEMVGRAAQLGLGAITITDHNTLNGVHKALRSRLDRKYNIKVFKGEEISTNQGHLLAIGIEEAIKPHLDVQEAVDLIRQQGGLSIAPHPFDIKGDGLKNNAIHCDAVETFNAINIDRLSNRAARQFAEKHGKLVTAGSDAHTTEMVGNAVINADFEHVDGLLKAIRNGNIEFQARYASVPMMSNLALSRLQLSYDHLLDYMEDNYSWPRRTVAKKALGLVEKDHIDSVFKALSYTTFAGVLIYSGARHVSRFRI
ncbi:MAG: PHP domain-containing protein [Candidatus Aenigmarchaeota archaeon]|nr:PHP domain-containing protein [Candidatus Aenigmarchaeota archaeon]